MIFPAKSKPPTKGQRSRAGAVRAAIESMAAPGAPVLFSKNELAGNCPGATRGEVDEAIAQLIDERALLALPRGRSVLYLHRTSVEPMLRPAGAGKKKPSARSGGARKVETGTVSQSPAARIGATTKSATTTAAATARTVAAATMPVLPLVTPRPDLDPSPVRKAYRALVRESGFSDVLISELHQRCGVAPEALKTWLLQESRAGRVLPTRGDWSIADAEARAAAIEIGGEPHLRVRIPGS